MKVCMERVHWCRYFEHLKQICGIQKFLIPNWLCYTEKQQNPEISCMISSVSNSEKYNFKICSLKNVYALFC